MHLTAGEIAARAAGELVSGDPSAFVTSWAFDSRALAPGACFVALRGHRDGHDFVADAFHRGARVALVDHVVAPSAQGGDTIVAVRETVAGLQAVARSVRAQRDGLRVVGVTGSTGKTSTKDLLAATLTERACAANLESYNNEFGLPIALLNTPASARVVVTEMGERFPGDIAALCDIARPEVGVVTNVGLAHAEHLGGLEGVARVLAELLESLPSTGLAVLDADDPWTPWLREHAIAPSITVGTGDDADLRIDDVALDAHLRPSFTLAGRLLEVPLRGGHQVTNAALAAAVAHVVFDVDWDEIARGLRSARPARWRMEIEESARGVVVVNDAYNANPDSMAAALRALAHLAVDGRRIAVLGDMRELGAHADAAHAQVGAMASELGIALVVGVGTGGAQIAAAASASGTPAEAVADAAAALRAARAAAAPGDAVLVKASRALGLQAVAEGLVCEEPAP